MSGEMWKPVPGYEGLYEVSNFGFVKGLKNNILKPYIMPNGYSQVTLYKGKRKTNKYVHRLVAETFVPNPQNLTEVNHKDENKQNNCVENLEWITHKKNLLHGSRSKRQSETLKRNQRLCKSVKCFSLDGKLLNTFGSIKKAATYTGAKEPAISACCKNKPHCKTAGGYKWQYE